MEQTRIWDHFQNHESAAAVFDNARPRYAYLAKQIKPHLSALNIGVGRGALEAMLIDKGVLVSCLDPSEKSIAQIAERHGLGERARVGFSQSMPFPDKHFDVVIMSEVLEHLSDDVLAPTLDEVRRVLKSGGRFIGTVPANEVLQDNQAICPHCGEAFHRWGHVQSFSLERVGDLLSEHGLAIVRNDVRAFPDWYRPGIGNFFKSLVRHVLGRFGLPIASPNLYFEARRLQP